MNRYFLNAWQSINKLLLIDIYFNIIIRKTKLMKYFVINNKILNIEICFNNVTIKETYNKNQIIIWNM